MLTIKSFTFNPFQENTYLLINEHKDCWIIDPGMFGPEETKQLLDYIDQEGLKPQQIINTHAHIDHILGINAVKEAYQIPFGMHKDELVVLDNAMLSAAKFGIPFKEKPTADFFIDEGKLMLGSDEIKVLLVPGHSPGSIAFYSEKEGFVINGDVLFQNSIGRTDLPGGDYDTLINSIRTKIFTLPDTTFVYSGHGDKTQIAYEKVNNPFLKN